MWAELGDDAGVAAALVGMSMVRFLQGDLVQAEKIGAEGSALARKVGDRYRLASSLGVEARVALDQGRPDAAFDLGAEALRLFAEAGDPTGTAMQIDDMGEMAYRAGDAVHGLRLAA